MNLDPVKLVKHRRKLGYSQQNVADKSDVNIRTVQRAEAGISVSGENAASIAAALQTTVHSISTSETAVPRVDQDGPPGKTVTLRRVTSARAMIDRLDQTYMCNMEWDVEPTSDNLELLKSVANLLEVNIPEPFNTDKLSWPPKRTMAERLDLLATLNTDLRALEVSGIGIFISEEWLDVYEPHYDPYHDQGFYYPKDQDPSGVRAVRIVISDHGSDKLARPLFVQWPVRLAIDLDDEVPF